MTKVQKLVAGVQTWAMTLDAKSGYQIHLAPVAVCMAITCEESRVPDNLLSAVQELISFIYRDHIGKPETPRPEWLGSVDDPASPFIQ